MFPGLARKQKRLFTLPFTLVITRNPGQNTQSDYSKAVKDGKGHRGASGFKEQQAASSLRFFDCVCASHLFSLLLPPIYPALGATAVHSRNLPCQQT